MSKLDGKYNPFTAYPGYSAMAPCMRDCNYDYAYNGCDNAACWCNKGNLDLRIATITRCASTSCTFANMNTATDVSMLSGIQVQYCVDHNQSPSGMALPSSTVALPTESSASETGAAETSTSTGTGTETRARPTSGPSATGTSDPTAAASSSSSSVLNTAAKAGISIGAVFCVLLAIVIILLLRRRKRQPIYMPPPPSAQNFQHNPELVAPTPYSGNGPFSPPPMQHPAPLHIPQANAAFAMNKRDVSPIEEKGPMTSITRKEVGGGKGEISPQSTPTTKKVQPASPAPASLTTALHENRPREVLGSMPPPRHEVANDGEVTHTVTPRGMELDAGQRPPVNQYPTTGAYQESGQGQWGYQYQGQGGHGGAHEVDGEHGRQELPGGQQQQRYPQYGQQHGGTYELGSGR